MVARPTNTEKETKKAMLPIITIIFRQLSNKRLCSNPRTITSFGCIYKNLYNKSSSTTIGELLLCKIQLFFQRIFLYIGPYALHAL